MSLEAIAYTSSAVPGLTDPALEQLLIDARQKNQELGITGVLLYHDGSFFQYFEGPPASVETVYSRIQHSRLHRGIFELMRAPVERRSFGNWLMGFTRAPASTVLQLSNAHWRRRLDEERDAAASGLSEGLSLLMNFWNASAGYYAR